MAELERLTVTMPSDLAAVVRAAVAEGDYALTSELCAKRCATGRSSAWFSTRKSWRLKPTLTRAWPMLRPTG